VAFLLPPILGGLCPEAVCAHVMLCPAHTGARSSISCIWCCCCTGFGTCIRWSDGTTLGLRCSLVQLCPPHFLSSYAQFLARDKEAARVGRCTGLSLTQLLLCSYMYC
jgi:hypothetical protein